MRDGRADRDLTARCITHEQRAGRDLIQFRIGEAERAGCFGAEIDRPTAGVLMHDDAIGPTVNRAKKGRDVGDIAQYIYGPSAGGA